jgi:hypothetical protein
MEKAKTLHAKAPRRRGAKETKQLFFVVFESLRLCVKQSIFSQLQMAVAQGVARASEAVNLLIFDSFAIVFSAAYRRKNPLFSKNSQLLPLVRSHGQDGRATLPPRA